MIINPITATDKPRWQKPRAYMVINQNEHTVVWGENRESRLTLKPELAWELHKTINQGLVV